MELAMLQMETLFVRDAKCRILSTREPQAAAGPLFMLIRSKVGCAWAVRADISQAAAGELERLAQEEPPLNHFHDAPLNAGQYVSILGGRVCSGPAFTFPDMLPQPPGVVLVEDEQLLNQHFHGWTPGELRAGRAPAMAVLDGGYPVSVCFCARRSERAAEAGVETAPAFRGQGFAPHVTAAWALAVRASGLIPLYSTDWSNAASLSVARKLRLMPYALDWSISD